MCRGARITIQRPPQRIKARQQTRSSTAAAQLSQKGSMAIHKRHLLDFGVKIILAAFLLAYTVGAAGVGFNCKGGTCISSFGLHQQHQDSLRHRKLQQQPVTQQGWGAAPTGWGGSGCEQLYTH